MHYKYKYISTINISINSFSFWLNISLPVFIKKNELADSKSKILK